MSEILSSLNAIRTRILQACQRVGRPSESVRLVAVSKTQGPEKIIEAIQAHQEAFGENYVQEWKKKRETLEEKLSPTSSKIRWHFIGHLQSNKANEVVGKVDLIHTIDSLKLAIKVSQAATQKNIVQPVLLEVKLAVEENKSGWLPLELLASLPKLAALPSLQWRGLMTIPPSAENPENTRPYFTSLKSLLDECNRSGVFREPLQELSMGMSHDFEVAIEEGATLVRVGTAIFGERK